MMFYCVVLRMWNLVGDSEFALRSLSVAAGLLSVPLLYGVGRQVFDERTGRIAALLIALSPLHVAYSQEARSYSFLIFFSILVTFLLLKCCEKNATSWFFYAVTSVLGLYSHVMFGLTLIGHAAAVGFSSELRTRYRNFLWALGSVAVLSFPLAYSVFTQGSHLGWVKESPTRLLAEFFSGLAGPSGNALLLAYGLLIACNLLLTDKGSSTWGSRVLWASFLIPLVLAWAVSWRIPFLVPPPGVFHNFFQRRCRNWGRNGSKAWRRARGMSGPCRPLRRTSTSGASTLGFKGTVFRMSRKASAPCAWRGCSASPKSDNEKLTRFAASAGIPRGCRLVFGARVPPACRVLMWIREPTSSSSICKLTVETPRGKLIRAWPPD